MTIDSDVINMPVKIGDIRYAIAYTEDTRVIEVIIREIDFEEQMIVIQSCERIFHFWKLAIADFYKWANFKTRADAEKVLEECMNCE